MPRGRRAAEPRRQGRPRGAHQRSRGHSRGPVATAQPPSAPPAPPTGASATIGSVRQMDHAVVVRVTPVDHRGLLGLRVDEQIEVVSDQLHLVERLVERHGSSRVGLLADDQRPFALNLQRTHPSGLDGLFVLLRDEGAVAGEPGRVRNVVHHLGRGNAPRAPAGVALVVLLAHPRVELGRGQVEGRVGVGRRRLGPDHGSTGADRDLDPVLPLGLPRVRFLGHLDVQADHLAVELLELLQLQLVGHVLAEPLGHLGLASLDDDVHAELRSRIAPLQRRSIFLLHRLRIIRSLGLGDFHLLLPAGPGSHLTDTSERSRHRTGNSVIGGMLSSHSSPPNISRSEGCRHPLLPRTSIQVNQPPHQLQRRKLLVSSGLFRRTTVKRR